MRSHGFTAQSAARCPEREFGCEHRFGSITRLLKSLGFHEHIRGDHHIFTRDGVEEIINLQPLRDGKAKAYQVRQVRQIITEYGLNLKINP